MVAPNVTGTPTSAGGGFGDTTVTYPTGDVAGEIFLTYVIGYAYGTLGTYSATGHTELGTHTWTGPLDTSEWRISWFGRIRDGTEGSTFTMTQSQSMYMNVICMRVADVDVSGTITAAMDVTPTVSTTGRSTTANLPTTTTVTNDATFFVGATPYDFTFSGGDPTGFTQEASALAQLIWSKEMPTAGGTGSASKSIGSTDDYMTIGVALKPAVTLSVEQEGFRFRTDSGNEATATWEAAQDTNVTMAAEVTKGLRVVIDYTGDPATGKPKLQYRRVGATDWRDV